MYGFESGLDVKLLLESSLILILESILRFDIKSKLEVIFDDSWKEDEVVDDEEREITRLNVEMSSFIEKVSGELEM